MKTRYFFPLFAALFLLPVLAVFSQDNNSAGRETKRTFLKDTLSRDFTSPSCKLPDHPLPLDVNVFPVPAKERISFSFVTSELAGIRVEIYELTGKQVVVFSPETSVCTLELSDFNKGIYFYKVFRNEALILGDKFIVIKE